MRTLILYYSLTGHTRKVGELLARKLNADVAELTCHAYGSGFGRLRQVWDMLTGASPPIELPPEANRTYDLVIVAGPVWGARPAPPVRSLLTTSRPEGGKVALFLTCNGTSKKYTGEKAVDEAARLAPVIATALFKEAEIAGPDLPAKVTAFAGVLREAMQAPHLHS